MRLYLQWDVRALILHENLAGGMSLLLVGFPTVGLAPSLVPRTIAARLKPLNSLLEGNLTCPWRRTDTDNQVPPNDPSTKSTSWQAPSSHTEGL